MPQKRSSEPPKAMTLPKAMPILVIAGLFDLIRMFFEMFWFFGPALAAAYCTVKVGGWVGYAWGLTAAICSGVAGAAGAAISEITIPLGVLMADAFALIGFLVLGFCIVIMNPRLFKVNKSAWLWMTGSLGVSTIPIIGTLPAFFAVLWVLYKRQIKVEKAALARWEKANEEERLKERNERMAAQAQFMQMQALQQAQVLQGQVVMQNAANDALYNQIQAANDDKYGAEEIPEKVLRAA